MFTIALFLLCAVRLHNPFRLLVLDDPLQNMDELTVTTVARGLAKLVQVLPSSWELMFLFHSEDDIERLRQELGGQIYALPWLTPEGKGDAPPITADPQRSIGERPLQNLIGTMEDRSES